MGDVNHVAMYRYPAIASRELWGSHELVYSEQHSSTSHCMHASGIQWIAPPADVLPATSSVGSLWYPLRLSIFANPIRPSPHAAAADTSLVVFVVADCDNTRVADCGNTRSRMHASEDTSACTMYMCIIHVQVSVIRSRVTHCMSLTAVRLFFLTLEDTLFEWAGASSSSRLAILQLISVGTA